MRQSALRPSRGPSWTDLPALALFVVHYLGQPPAGIDDAWIFYRYAANWAAGLGPTFNPGERVEGFSSVLWTALLAAASACGVSPEVAGCARSAPSCVASRFPRPW